MTLGKISTIIGILSAIVGSMFWVFNYHLTLATNLQVEKRVANLYVELRLKDIEQSIVYLSQKKKLTEFEKVYYKNQQATLVRLNAERDKLIGLVGSKK